MKLSLSLRTALLALAGLALVVLLAVALLTPLGSNALNSFHHAASRLRAADLASVSLVVSIAALAGLVWLGMKMSATARRLYEPADLPALDEKSMYRLILELHAEVQALRHDVQDLQRRRPFETTSPGSRTPGPVERSAGEARRGPGDADEDLWVSPTPQPGRQAQPESRRPEARAPGAAPRHPARPEPTAFSASRPGNVEQTIAAGLRDPRYLELIAAYRDLLRSGGGMAEFEREYDPAFVSLLPSGEIRELPAGEEVPYWFIGSRDTPELGLLLPAKGPIQQWGEKYQFGGGSAAQKVFSPAFDVEAGDVLEITEPAWAVLIDHMVHVQRRGRLRGA